MIKNGLLLLFLLFQCIAFGYRGQANLSKQPLSFIENKGQLLDQQGNPRTDIDFILATPGMTLFVGKGSLHYQYWRRQKPDTTVYSRGHKPARYTVGGPGIDLYRVDVQLTDCNSQAARVTEQSNQEKYNYYKGQSADGITGVRSYNKITYKNIYPSIDWVLYIRDNELKYDFIVHPGGKVSDIKMKYDGADNIQLASDGSLEVALPFGKITEAAPYSYEAESKRMVNSKFLLKDQVVSFQTAKAQGTLVIDPGVDWATYFGSAGLEAPTKVAVDGAGFVYITGFTDSYTGIATVGAYQVSFGGGIYDHYLAKFDSLGVLQWATYYGGGGTTDFLSGLELYSAITCDAFGHVYLAGQTLSEDNIATAGSYQPAINPLPSNLDNSNGYLVKFDTSGVRQWGTYYGASAHYTQFSAVGCDKLGNIYVLGESDSTSSSTNQIASAGAHQVQCGGDSDALLVKFDSSGNRLWATYYGGQGFEFGYDVACDDSNNVYICGATSTSITGIASPGAYQDSIPEVAGDMGFLAKFNPAGVRQWGTYINGYVNSLALDTFNHLFIAGTSNYSGTDMSIATPGAWLQTNPISNYIGFLMQFNAQNCTRDWGTYYGAEKHTYGRSVACDGKGNVYFAGETDSYDPLGTEAIASSGSHQDTLCAPAGLTNPNSDALLVQFDTMGRRKWASYYGGLESDGANDIICSPSGAIYMLISTSSTSNIATAGSHQAIAGGGGDAALVRWLPVDIGITALITPENDTICAVATPINIAVTNYGLMAKTDTLFVTCKFTGPINGQLDTFFTDDLAIGMTDSLYLGSPDFAFSGTYNFTTYLHYTRDDNERDNDTLHFTLTVTNVQPIADINVNQVGTVFFFSNNNMQPGDTYYWEFGDGASSTESNPQHQYSLTDSYQVMLVVTNYCGSDTAYIKIKGIGNGTSVTSTTGSEGITVYPNPATATLFIRQQDQSPFLAYEIVNTLGQVVKSGTGGISLQIPVAGLSEGNYVIRLHTSKGIMQRKFAIVRP